MQEELKPDRVVELFPGEFVGIAPLSDDSSCPSCNVTRKALRALLHYIDHSGTWPEGWSMEMVREVASQ